MLFHWTCFYDDFFLVGSDAEAKHLDLMQKGFFALLGWATSDEKGEELKAVARALGVEFSFADTRAGLIRVANTPGRVAELGATIDRLLNVGFVSASELVSLRGRLLFAESQVFGRQSKRAMKILSSRCTKCGRVFFDQELRDALILLRDRVVRGGPRVVAAVHRNRYLVFADACHESDGAGFGGILYSSSGLIIGWFSEWLSPDDLAPINPLCKKTLIHELELTASLISFTHLCSKLQPSDIVAFTDNEAVLSNLITGNADNPLVLSFLDTIYGWESSSGHHVWFERVASLANPADGPSRMDFKNLPSSLRVRVDIIKVWVLRKG